MKQVDHSRRDSMKKIAIAASACAVLSQVNLSTNPEREVLATSRQSLEEQLKQDFAHLNLSPPELDVFITVKRNVLESKKVKDEQIVEFAKEIVKNSPQDANFEVMFSNLQSEFLLMDHFIRYVHA
ncbi:hypothetical protein LRP49_04945 [Enterovibrio sp. ZSDZ35]|uniref:Tat (Twin-arginine translocation) pathway signal sequence n=1 Tax=Enterovibrio qingdaonensis TaxID=2899818 RepID=A0ABT5QIN9_9GAMM|nr:hypothetical protein [Enterovibrio sp. ZSDZ35]MDD1780543.1 hypothetical protein [Enterovibrio sp. ZSDZ35]